MAGEIYRKPIMFCIVATLVILAGSVVTMFYPMLRPEMHPKLENLKAYTALQLAGKDIYQREGCNNCHTQTVRPLRTEVMRYGDYSKAGEFAYDRPFLWGSKRTGPDLARIGGKYPDAWHYQHFEKPKAFHPQSNMPIYGWLKQAKLDPGDVEARMKVNDFPYTREEIGALASKTELDALVAYMQVIGTAVKKGAAPVSAAAAVEGEANPFAKSAQAIADGKKIYADQCATCHGPSAEGGIGPSLKKKQFLGQTGDAPDGAYFHAINSGVNEGDLIAGRKGKGGMPGFSSNLDKNKIWSLVAYIRSIQGN